MGGGTVESKYVLYVSNVSSDTRTKEVRYATQGRRCISLSIVKHLSCVTVVCPERSDFFLNCKVLLLFRAQVTILRRNVVFLTLCCVFAQV